MRGSTTKGIPDGSRRRMRDAAAVEADCNAVVSAIDPKVASESFTSVSFALSTPHELLVHASSSPPSAPPWSPSQDLQGTQKERPHQRINYTMLISHLSRWRVLRQILRGAQNTSHPCSVPTYVLACAELARGTLTDYPRSGAQNTSHPCSVPTSVLAGAALARGTLTDDPRSTQQL
eukprot:CAMPEP_0194552224 /NCGR_PEP_ID=MMETSP0253-20130528/96617_1 /TAXON_ID=2966 /ORGANISM="Noctiluca scintillans" /LENGTH=176 /DNA_ID=CAMNT_0039399689 /DNA_START=30 /DNA_END=560 /DNA_ORIENTATION=+